MAYETGTATDYKDLLLKLRDFMIGDQASPAPNLGWIVERQYADNQSPEPAEYEMIFRGDGESSPERNLWFGVQTYSDATPGYYNWSVQGFTGYSSTSPETQFKAQPGNIFGNQISDGAGITNGQIIVVPLQNTSMTYWFHVNGRRVIMVVKTGTSYQFMYAGFIDTYGTETEWPYPMMVMGSAYKETQVFSDNDLDYAGLPSPVGNSAVHTTAFSGIQAVGWLRLPDGEWRAVKNYQGTSTLTGLPTFCVSLWPMGPTAQGSEIDPEFPISNNNMFENNFFKNTAGGTPTASLAKSENSPGGVTSIWPFTLVYRASGGVSYHLGELNNCYWLSALGGVTSEDTLSDTGASPEGVYRVFQQVHRTDPWNFYAVKEE